MYFRRRGGMGSQNGGATPARRWRGPGPTAPPHLRSAPSAPRLHPAPPALSRGTGRAVAPHPTASDAQLGGGARAVWAANGRRGGAHARSIMRLAVCECWGACCLRVAASGCEHMRRNPRCTDRTSRRQTAICPLRRGGRIGAGRGWRLLKRRDAHDRRWHKCSGASCCAVACAQSCGRLDTRGRLEPWCTSGRHSAPRRLTRVQRCAPSGARPRAPRSLGGRRCSAWVGRSGASGSWPSSRTPSPGGRAQSPKPGASADGGRGGGGRPVRGRALWSQGHGAIALSSFVAMGHCRALCTSPYESKNGLGI